MTNRIRELRRAKGITMKQLGIAVGLAESTISQYENGKRQPDNETLIKLSNFFGVTVGYVLGAEKCTPAETGKCAENDINLTKAELDMIMKFRRLDDRGRSAVLNALDHEYAALPQEGARNVLRIAARDGSYQEVTLTDQQASELEIALDKLPDVPKGL